jgi:outer membrane protein assembly factor BamB
MFSSRAIAGDLAYVGSRQGQLVAVNLKTQKLAWTLETENPKKSGPTFTKADGTPNN